MPGQLSVRGLLGHRNFQFKNVSRSEDWLEVKNALPTSSNVPLDATLSCCSTKSDWTPLYVPNETPRKREFYKVGNEDDSLLDMTLEALAVEEMRDSFWIGKT